MSAAPLPPRVVPGAPEQLFSMTGLDHGPDGTLRGSMPTGPWLADERGVVRLAALGVLIDNVGGYAVNSMTDGWSVTTELSVDVVGDPPLDGSCIHGDATVVHHDADGALVRGTVTTDEGSIVAHFVLRGRFTASASPRDAPAGPGRQTELDRSNLVTLLGPGVTCGGDHLAVVDVTPRFLNPLGAMHGGMVFAVHELVGAVLLPAPERTASLRVQFARGVPAGTRLVLDGTALHTGRTLAVGHVVATDEHGRICSSSTIVRH